jgi:hypothetical protein
VTVGNYQLDWSPTIVGTFENYHIRHLYFHEKKYFGLFSYLSLSQKVNVTITIKKKGFGPFCSSVRLVKLRRLTIFLKRRILAQKRKMRTNHEK